jgi:dTDP-4-amino-4,6-dideoxygalactose transaminase
MVLIEDLAHCVGTTYHNGQEAGLIGDFVVLSFSQDKIIDAISGGSLIIRNKKFQNKLEGIKFRTQSESLKNRLYPYFTYKIRKLYGIGLGKIYHFFLKKLGFLSDIMNESYYEYFPMPSLNAKLALRMFRDLKTQIEHRRNIARIYTSRLSESMFMFDRQKTLQAVSVSSNLRFPIFVKNRSELLNMLKQNNILLSDIWYTEVAPECENAESDSKIILNLPTHINTSENDANNICDLITEWNQKK